MTIVVDMSDANNMTVTCTAGEAQVVVTKYIYLVGSMSGWIAPALKTPTLTARSALPTPPATASM